MPARCMSAMMGRRCERFYGHTGECVMADDDHSGYSDTERLDWLLERSALRNETRESIDAAIMAANTERSGASSAGASCSADGAAE